MARGKTLLPTRVRNHLGPRTGNGFRRNGFVLAQPLCSLIRDYARRQTGRAALRTLTIHLPLFHNPTPSGYRRPMETHLLEQTLKEIKYMFPGLSAYRVSGWCKSKRPGGDSDQHVRVEIDTPVGTRQRTLLSEWKKQVLNVRLDQRDIFMRLSGPIWWL